MCANLATKSPVPVCAYDLNSAAVSTAVEKGAVAATDLEDIARAEMVFVCVPGEAETRSVFLDEGGLCEHARAGTTFIDCTTATVDVNREVAEALRSLQMRLWLRRSALSAAIPRVPAHLGLALGDEPIDMRKLADLVGWCAELGIHRITLCDAHGMLLQARE